MTLIRSHRGSPVELRLARDLTRLIKRGHPWVFADALRQLPPATPGAQAVLLDNKKGREIARGFYDPHSPLAFRACTTNPGESLDDTWARKLFESALALRRILFDERTTGFRIFNGEGDGLPGLVGDVYGDMAVLQLDGAGPGGFWDGPGIARWMAKSLSLHAVFERNRAEGKGSGRFLFGQAAAAPIVFLENGVRFTVDVVRGQKTGFFLDQRDNRQKIRDLAAGRKVLNVFGYTGGFSVYAGLGGAKHVTTVDLAGPALETAQVNWQLNQLPSTGHEVVSADAFEFLAKSAQERKTWDLVIVDPPSFASSQGAIPKAMAAYQKLIGAAAAVTSPEGLLAAASCSSHISLEAFLKAGEEGISLARRTARVLHIGGQPADHPTPLVLPEFRYLKFVLMRVD